MHSTGTTNDKPKKTHNINNRLTQKQRDILPTTEKYARGGGERREEREGKGREEERRKQALLT